MITKTAVILCGFLLNGLNFAGAQVGPNEEIPFVPTPGEVIDRMLELVQVKKGDVVYDVASATGGL